MIQEKKTGKDRTQPAKHNEEWSDERVKAFLNFPAPEGVPQDYHVLLKAYRGMLPEQFERFVKFFVEDGRDINVRLANGSTFLDHVSGHARSTEYRDILIEAGAQGGQTH
ncbi:MAG TPA: PA4642 family protein [Pseudohongiella sp.]|nr:PA4642 family protein [Pseudohongiella sp.]